MLNPGPYLLASRSLTTAITGEAQTAVDKLAGILAAMLTIQFAYGSGGTSCKVYVQVSPNQGVTWIDVACATFTTSSGVKVFNLSALTPKTTPITPTDGALADDTYIDGILGHVMRVKITSTGTYGGNTGVFVYLDAK
ncbi:MAG: hypothetical protein AB7O57_20095 [Hyphomicrobiaceae bacterium]